MTPEAPKPVSDLATTLSRHPSAKDGSAFSETVTVTNHGPSAAPNVVTKVILPGHLSVVSTHGGRQAGAVISWTDALLGVGKSVSYTVTVKVAAQTWARCSSPPPSSRRPRIRTRSTTGR